MLRHTKAGDIGASDLGEKLEQAVNMALNEVMAILGFSLDPDDRAFSSILKAKTTILGSSSTRKSASTTGGLRARPLPTTSRWKSLS
jgi:hypothetical protein